MNEISRRFFLFGTGAALAVSSAGSASAFLPEIPEPEGWVEAPNYPSMAKAWAMFNREAGLIDCYNISSVERTGVGIYTLRFKEGLFDRQPVVAVTADERAIGAIDDCSCVDVVVKTFDDGGNPIDPQRASMVAFGF